MIQDHKGKTYAAKNKAVQKKERKNYEKNNGSTFGNGSGNGRSDRMFRK